MANQSIFNKLLAELQITKNHDASIKRCKEIISSLEEILQKRIISYFASEIGDETSMINDEDSFIIENLLRIESDKKDLILILHSDGGLALSAERIIELCRNHCKKTRSQFVVLVPKKAKSAATIIALGADRIVLRDTAELGPVDPQFIVTDQNGNMQVEPAYLYVDALENFCNPGIPFIEKVYKKTNPHSLILLPKEAKLKLIEQCNYPMYVNAKNELGLSDSIMEKILNEKIKANKKISAQDFKIFRDPHITKSHGRLINLSDLWDNGLLKYGVIIGLKKFLFDKSERYKDVDEMLWELYVRKRQLLNDTGNPIVKNLETIDEFFIASGKKRGQDIQRQDQKPAE